MDIPGDSSTTTTVNAGDTLDSDIGFAGDLDYIRTSLVAGLSYHFVLSTTNNTLAQSINLLSNSGAFISAASGNDVTDATINYIATTTQNHFISVSDATNTNTGDYTLKVVGTDTIIGNTTTTETLAPGGTLNSAIDVAVDNDFVRTNLVAGLTYGFAVSTNVATLTQNLELFTETGAFLRSGNGTNASPATISYTAATTQSHYLNVSDLNSAGTGDYTLTINGDDTIVNNRTTSQSLLPGNNLASAVDVSSDVDFISTDLLAGIAYEFTLTTSSASLLQEMDFFTNTGAFIKTANGDSSNAATFTHTSATDHTYFVGVGDLNNTGTGTYTLTINNDDTIIGNNTTGQSLASGAIFSSNVDVAGDEDYIRIDLTAGVTFHFRLLTTNGTLSQNLELYSNTGGFLAADDGNHSTSATFSHTATASQSYFININDLNNTATGEYTLLIYSSINDIIIGTSTGDVLYGGGLDDTISGNVGEDAIYGETGNDILHGGNDNDLVDGGSGDDTLFGDAGNDSVHGGQGADHVSGGGGVDQLFGDGGNDTLLGGVGNDMLDGGSGDDELFGQEDTDTLNGGDGDDVLDGGAGNDILNGQGDADVLRGNIGDDLISGGAGNDFLFGQAGSDTLFAGIGDDLLTGGGSDDTLYGENGADRLFSGGGDDFVYGGDGDDFVVGNSGIDLIDGGNGADTILGDTGNDRLLGGNGDDLLDGGEDDDQLFGQADNDLLLGNNGSDYLNGGGGNDRLFGQAGNDTLFGGDGIDTLGGGGGIDNITGGGGTDRFVFFMDWGQDTVHDFEDGVEKANVSDASVFIQDFSVTTLGLDAIVDFGGADTITFVGQAGNIDVTDFIF